MNRKKGTEFFSAFFVTFTADKTPYPLTAPGTYNEKEMLRRIAGGDGTAFEMLFHAWRDKLYFFLLRLTSSPETAEDALQDVFVKLWTNRQSLTSIDNFSAYLYRLAQNHAINGLRRNALYTVLLGEIQRTGHSSVSADDSLLHKQLREKIQIAISNLPPQQKKVYTLSRVNGLKHEEIARELNISLSTVKNHMTQALFTIRKFLESQFPMTAFSCLALMKILSA